ncbi:MAG: copper homeostasis protein CutC [Bacteroidales bacterium]
MKKKFLVEVCANSVPSAIAAQKGGANRVELCDNLYEGGTTPSFGTIKFAREALSIKLNVMIRPRGNDFCYSHHEFDIMKADIEMAKKLGADGVVFGILLPNAIIDLERTAELVQLSRPMTVTFHRAFDMTPDLNESLEMLIKLGIDCVLTSGGKNKAHDAIQVLAGLNKQATGRISVMAGSGINEQNILEIEANTGLSAFHVSLRKKIDSLMIYRKTNIFMGGLPEIPEYELAVTDENRVKMLVELLNGG